MEEVVNDFGIGAMSLYLQIEGAVLVHGNRLDLLGLRSTALTGNTPDNKLKTQALIQQVAIADPP